MLDRTGLRYQTQVAPRRAVDSTDACDLGVNRNTVRKVHQRRRGAAAACLTAAATAGARRRARADRRDPAGVEYANHRQTAHHRDAGPSAATAGGHQDGARLLGRGATAVPKACLVLQERPSQPLVEFASRLFCAIISQRALPDHRNPPSKLQQLLPALLVAGGVTFELFLPIFLPRRWRSCKSATGMRVPEASVHEAHRTVFWKNKVWLSRKISVMQPVPQPTRMHCPAEEKLRAGVLPSYP